MRLVTSSPTNQGRTTKPRLARQSGSLSGNAQTSRRRLVMTRQAWTTSVQQMLDLRDLDP
jgi:hypothetical protein